MQQTEFMKTARKISNKLKKHPKIDLILLYGSVAEGVSDRYSDLDMGVYIAGPDKKDVDKMSSLLGIDMNFHGKIPFKHKFFVDGIEISLHVDSTRLQKNTPARNDNLSPFTDYAWQKLIVTFAVNAIPLYDRKNVFKKFGKLKELPKKFQIHILSFEYDKLLYYFGKNYFGEDSDNIEVFLKRKNKIAVIRAFEQTNERIFKILFALNDKFLVNEKWVSAYIKKFRIKPRNCEKRLERMMAIGLENNFDENLRKKTRLYKKFTEDLGILVKKKLRQVG